MWVTLTRPMRPAITTRAAPEGKLSSAPKPPRLAEVAGARGDHLHTIVPTTATTMPRRSRGLNEGRLRDSGSTSSGSARLWPGPTVSTSASRGSPPPGRSTNSSVIGGSKSRSASSMPWRSVQAAVAVGDGSGSRPHRRSVARPGSPGAGPGRRRRPRRRSRHARLRRRASQALTGCRACSVDVSHPLLDRRLDERRRDQENLRLAAPDVLGDRIARLLAADLLGSDDEHSIGLGRIAHPAGPRSTDARPTGVETPFSDACRGP